MLFTFVVQYVTSFAYYEAGLRGSKAIWAVSDSITCYCRSTLVLYLLLGAFLITEIGNCFHSRLRPPGHHPRPLHWARRNSSRIRSHCTSMAILQQEPSTMGPCSWEWNSLARYYSRWKGYCIASDITKTRSRSLGVGQPAYPCHSNDIVKNYCEVHIFDPF
jgi:hypothetical protein